ncbi:MAG: AlpA family transcriptional regulator [Truepera sp.]|nr:AlpA family transcriptional regulator [Truepera sp.]
MKSVIEQGTRRRVRFLRLPEVLARTGLSRSTIYVRLDQGRFPRPVSLGARAVGWIEAEVDEWMRERIAAGLAQVRAAVDAILSHRARGQVGQRGRLRSSRLTLLL